MEAPAEAAAVLSRRASPANYPANARVPSANVVAYSSANDRPEQQTHQQQQQQQEQQQGSKKKQYFYLGPDSALKAPSTAAASDAPLLQQDQPDDLEGTRKDSKREKDSFRDDDRYNTRVGSGNDGSNSLLLSTQVPLWYAANQHILTGYRPLRPSVPTCFRSIVQIHNETVNIHSHLIPGLLALTGNYALHLFFNSRFPEASISDRLVMHIFLTGSVICFSISAVYHALLCHSERYHDLWLRLDYVGIVLQILGSFISGIYMGFYCEPGPRALYWGMIGVLSFMTIFVMLHPRFQSQDYRVFRLWTFVITGLSGFAPILHAAALFPYRELETHMGVRWYYLEGLLILTGAFVYGIHFPEKWYPVRFDIWGASHQIFHVCVVLGAASHFYGILSAYAYNYDNPRC